MIAEFRLLGPVALIAAIGLLIIGAFPAPCVALDTARPSVPGDFRAIVDAAPNRGAPGDVSPRPQAFSGVPDLGLPPFGLILLGFGGYVGKSTGLGSIYGQPWFPGSDGAEADDGVFSWSASVSLETNINDLLWIEVQLNLSLKGRYFQWNYPSDGDETNDWWIEERVLYLQVPVLAKVRIVPDIGLSLTLAGGPALNLAVSAGGDYWDWYDSGTSLPADYYSGFLSVAGLSAVAEAGVHFGLGDSVLGLLARADYDMTGNFDYGSYGSSRFRTLSIGLRLAVPLSFPQSGA